MLIGRLNKSHEQEQTIKTMQQTLLSISALYMLHLCATWLCVAMQFPSTNEVLIREYILKIDMNEQLEFNPTTQVDTFFLSLPRNHGIQSGF